MTIQYRLSENDFLQYQLFAASRSDKVKKQMTRGRVVNFIFFACLAVFFIKSGSRFLGYYFLVLAGLMILFFPLYSKWRYKNYYKKFVRETYSDQFDQEVTLTITENKITKEDVNGKTQVDISDFDIITETGQYYYMHLISGGQIIIPKEKLQNPEDVRSAVLKIATAAGISFNEETVAKW